MNILSDWLQGLLTPTHSSEWINGATGAGGAILGSLVTITWTAWYNGRTRRRERREKFAAGAFAAYQRLNQIYSVSKRVRDHLETGRAVAAERKQPVCTTTMGMQRMSGPVVFPIEELWTLTQVGGTKLVNRVNSLDHSFNHLLDSVERYAVIRQEVWAALPLPESMEGVVANVRFTQDQERKIRPGIAALDHMLEQITPIARSIVIDTFEALTLLVHAKTKPLGKKFSVTFPNPVTGEPTTISAQDTTRLPWWRKIIKSARSV